MKSILSASLLCLLAFFSYAQKKGNPVPEMKAIFGEWEVWISGAVTYVARDARIYRDYQPGAPMNRLTIRENGDYIWGDHKGILKRVTPWYGETGRAYYRISDKKNNTYDFWYNKEEDKLIVLFGEVGGHAATGTRWGTSEKKDDPSPASEPAPAPGSPSDHPAGTRQKGTDTNGQTTEKGPGTAGEKVEINWSGSWHKGTIVETGNGKYKVRYDGWGSLYDEWISADRLRKLPWDRSPN